MANLLVSFPRSGRAWTMTICEELARRLPGGLKFSHSGDGANTRAYGKYKSDKSSFRKHRVNLVVRDPRDVVVSHWHILHYRRQAPPASELSLFEWTKHKHGLDFVVRFLNDWAKAIETGRLYDVHVVRYERLIEDPIFTIKAMAFFFNVPLEHLKTELIREVADATTFSKIREAFAHSNEGDDERAYSARLGQAGVWREYYTDEEQEWIEGYLDTHLNRNFWTFYGPD